MVAAAALFAPAAAHADGALQFTPDVYDFGSQTIAGGPTAPQVFTLENIGDDTVFLTSLTVAGSTGAFPVDVSPNDACTPGTQLDPGGTCTATVRFDPSTTGLVVARFTAGDGNVSAFFDVGGTGTTSGPTPTPSPSPTATPDPTPTATPDP
ncbi:MAG: choice-of-anchor D domain-containing protein, partial [Solirubrobacteraceae bacterium]|nr:choice-of-anchor D domain-containing protein [Solirubrobacteraceae bacterium]